MNVVFTTGTISQAITNASTHKILNNYTIGSEVMLGSEYLKLINTSGVQMTSLFTSWNTDKKILLPSLKKTFNLTYQNFIFCVKISGSFTGTAETDSKITLRLRKVSNGDIIASTIMYKVYETTSDSIVSFTANGVAVIPRGYDKNTEFALPILPSNYMKVV